MGETRTALRLYRIYFSQIIGQWETVPLPDPWQTLSHGKTALGFLLTDHGRWCFYQRGQFGQPCKKISLSLSCACSCTLKETYYLCFKKHGHMYIYVHRPVPSCLYRKQQKIGLLPNHVEHATWKEQRHLENHSTISEEITGEIPDDWKNSPLWDSYFISQFHLDFFFLSSICSEL